MGRVFRSARLGSRWQIEKRVTADRISETVSLPANDPEAIAFLRSQSSAPSAPSTTAASTNPTLPAGLDNFSVPPDSFPEVQPGQTDSLTTDSPAASTTDPAPPPSTTPAPRPPVPVNKAAIRRKPRQSLEQMAAGLKGKKMTTLEKASDCIQVRPETSADARSRKWTGSRISTRPQASGMNWRPTVGAEDIWRRKSSLIGWETEGQSLGRRAGEDEVGRSQSHAFSCRLDIPGHASQTPGVFYNPQSATHSLLFPQSHSHSPLATRHSALSSLISANRRLIAWRDVS